MNSKILLCLAVTGINHSPSCTAQNKFSLTTENLANILEHMQRDVKWFFRAGVGNAGETITASVLTSRCDSSPVIDPAPHHPDLNSFWIGRSNTTTGLKPQRERMSYLITFASFLRSSMKSRNSRRRVSSSGARRIEE